MESYQELLTLGEYLEEEDLINLYNYLRKNRISEFESLIRDLNKFGSAESQVANGLIKYVVEKGRIYNSQREIGAEEWYSDLRKMWFFPNYFFNKSRLMNFFAQCEVDAIKNFPLPGENFHSKTGYSIHSYPFYNLNYYSNGRGKIRGLISKYKN